MDDIWIISWFNHTAFDANPIWKSPMMALVKLVVPTLPTDCCSQTFFGMQTFPHDSGLGP